MFLLYKCHKEITSQAEHSEFRVPYIKYAQSATNIKEHFTDDRSQIGSHEFKEVPTHTSVRRSPGPEQENPVTEAMKKLGKVITSLYKVKHRHIFEHSG